MSESLERGRGHTLIQSTLLGEAAELAPIGIFVTDETLAFIAANRFGCEMLGYDRGDLLRMRVSDLAVRDVADLESDYRTLMRDGALEVEGPVRLADESIRTIRYRAYRTSVAGMDVLFGFASFLDDAPIVVQPELVP
jgi:PAS domain-containing protein